MFFHIQIRGPLNSIRNALFYWKGFEKGLLQFCFTGFFLLFYQLVRFFSASRPLCSCLPVSSSSSLFISLAPHRAHLSSRFPFLGRLPSVPFEKYSGPFIRLDDFLERESRRREPHLALHCASYGEQGLAHRMFVKRMILKLILHILFLVTFHTFTCVWSSS